MGEADLFAEDRARLVLELRQGGIKDPSVIAAMEAAPREYFIPDKFQKHAYDNTALPLAAGQTVSQPLIVGLMTEALELHDRAKVLEIGTGSGYQATVLSLLARRVYTIERIRPLLREAEARFKALQRDNIVTKHGDGAAGWSEQAPFDCILLTAAPDAGLPQALIEQLKPRGRLVAPIGGAPLSQRLIKLVKQEDGSVLEKDLGACRFVPLLEGVE